MQLSIKQELTMSRPSGEGGVFPLVRVQANLILTYLNSDSLHTKIRIADPEAPLAFYSELFTEITMNPEEIK